jgi:hypothetical protein
MKKLILLFIFVTTNILSFPKTDYPLTHFFLNLIGPACIIKGSSLQIPFVKYLITIEKEVNWPLMCAGTFCLVTSRILLLMEKRVKQRSYS